MSTSYQDNAVPFGSRTEDIKRGLVASATDVGTYIFEDISLKRPGHVGERPDQIGGPNGWWVTATWPTGTGTIQVPIASSETPKIGDWFQDTFDGITDAPLETWVIVDVDQPFKINDYFKVNVTLRLAQNPN
jgi:hypothetical protein